MSNYKTKINDIYNFKLDPVFPKTNAEYFKDKKLLYYVPLANILEYKEAVSAEEFRVQFPLTVRELLEVAKSENETEQECLITIAENEMSPRAWALRRLLL